MWMTLYFWRRRQADRNRVARYNDESLRPSGITSRVLRMADFWGDQFLGGGVPDSTALSTRFKMWLGRKLGISGQKEESSDNDDYELGSVFEEDRSESSRNGRRPSR